MTDWRERVRHLAVAFGIGVLGPGAVGCSTPAVEYDAYGYPVDYPVPLQDRYGICARHRHPDCHAHHRHYIDEHGDQQVYLWEHAHYRESIGRASREPEIAHESAALAQETSLPVRTDLASSTDGSRKQDELIDPVSDVPPGSTLITAITDRGEQIEILAGGPLDNFDSFVLEEPRRIIVDFWGVWSDVQPGRIASETGPVAEIRISQHFDRVRLVLHLRVEDASHRVQPTTTGAEIMLGSGGATAGGD